MDRIHRMVFLVVLLVCTSTIYGQDTYQDVVYLKNGSIVRGLIVESSNDQLKVRSEGGSIFIFQRSEIRKITQELTTGQGAVKEDPVPKSIITPMAEPEYKRKGYVNYTEFSPGLIVGPTKYDFLRSIYDYKYWYMTPYVRLTTVNGYKFADGIASVGLGVGLEFFMSERRRFGYLQMPLYLDLRVMPLKKELSPFAMFGIGDSFNLISDKDVDVEGGLVVSGGFGVINYFTSNTAMTVSLALDFHRRSETYVLDGQKARADVTQRFLRINIGFSF